MKQYVLTGSCPNTRGITAGITSLISEHGGDIQEAHQFADIAANQFFFRVAFQQSTPISELEAKLVVLAKKFKLICKLDQDDLPTKLLILVSKFDHCLVDLLYRHRIGELKCEIVGIVSNHPPTQAFKDSACQIPYHYLPISQSTKEEQERALESIIEDSRAELIVLARYMQVLSDSFSKKMEQRCINIHHSFLPGFKGAKPYHQAFDRGVKMIGATAHYITPDLDEGPIIAQSVEPISHSQTPEELVAKGREIECKVLANAVKLHLQHRVLLNDQKTVIFEQ